MNLLPLKHYKLKISENVERKSEKGRVTQSKRKSKSGLIDYHMVNRLITHSSYNRNRLNTSQIVKTSSMQYAHLSRTYTILLPMLLILQALKS